MIERLVFAKINGWLFVGSLAAEKCWRKNHSKKIRSAGETSAERI